MMFFVGESVGGKICRSLGLANTVGGVIKRHVEGLLVNIV